MTAMRDKSPLIPMAAMTGCPSRDLIRRRLDQYAEVGIRQFLIYARSGCELEYMGTDWFEACRHVLECADELDMDIWLYDEFNWPSGRCNGEVMEGHPEFRAKTLVGTKNDDDTVSWGVKPVDGHADLFNSAAMERFIALTHGRYEEHFASYLGTRIKGIFTDEPSFMYGRGRSGDGKSLYLPYYDGLEEDYASASGGRVLRDDLSAVLNGRDVPGLWPIFHEVLGQRFRDTFFAPIQKWCDAHGMVSTGHLMCETPPSASVKASGTPLACLASFSLPGIDDITTRVTFDTAAWGTLHMARYAAARSGNTGLAELFALGPPDLPFGVLRQMIWLCALHGITEYVLAVSPLDARGNLLKRSYFTAFTPIQTWFDNLPLLAEDSTEAAEIAHVGIGPGIVIRYPWALACEDAGRDLLGVEAEHRSGRLFQISRALIGEHWPVRLIDEGEAVPDDTRAVIKIAGAGFVLSTGEKQTPVASLEEAVAWLEANVERPFTISGNVAPGQVFAELLADRRVCLLNMTNTDLPGVCVTAGERSISLRLPARGVRVLDMVSTESDCTPVQPTAGEENIPFALELDRDNLMRCRMAPVDETTYRFAFRCDASVTGRLLVRSPQELDTVWIDGNVVPISEECTSLPEGIREFYRAGAPVQLTPGEHSLELAGKVDDAPYLPAAFLAGDFGLYDNDTLKALPTEVGCEDLRLCGLRNYGGRVTLSGETKVPDGAEGAVLCLDTGEHIAEVKVNGTSLGTRAWAPFEWNIPEALRGQTVSLEVTLTPSVGAIFDHPEEVKYGHAWLRDFWPGQYAALGILTPLSWMHSE